MEVTFEVCLTPELNLNVRGLDDITVRDWLMLIISQIYLISQTIDMY